MPPSDPVERATWAKRSVQWLRAAPEAESVDDTNNQALISAAGIETGQRVLDLASGAGEPAISIALRVGAGGAVIASDFSPEMLEGARRRSFSLGLSQIQFIAAAMEQLPLADRIFDAVTCRFGLMFPGDRVAAVAEARRVLVPGGTAAWMVWGPLEDNALHCTLAEAVRAHFGDPVSAAPPRRHVLGAPGALRELMEAAGFADVEERALKGVRQLRADRAFWRGRVERNHSERFQALDPAGREALLDVVEAAFDGYRDGETYRLEHHVRIGTGTAPA